MKRGARVKPRGGPKPARPGAPSPGRGPERGPERPARERAAAPRVPAWVWPIAGALVFLVMLWACRNYALGVPVADDYSFLYRLGFQKPLDALDSMGATYYWRPLSRQAYFSLVGGTLLATPWLAAFANGAILLGTYALLYRIARRCAAPAAAAAIAVFPLASEPARALLAWPSGAQHLLAGLFAVLTIELALGRRWIPAALAGGCGVLSHESAALAVLAIPFVAWLGPDAASGRDAGVRRRAIAIATVCAASVLAAWALGYSVARSHGVELPPRPPGNFVLARLPDLLGRAIPAALDLEDLAPSVRTSLLIGHAALLIAALLALAMPVTRRRAGRAGRFAIAGLAWFGAGALPLTQILPDWNAWRAWVPTIGIGVGLGAALGTVSPWLAIAFASLRILALAIAPPALPTVLTGAPATASHMSYVRLVRLQRTLESTRHALATAHPTLPHGADVRFWNLPRLAEVGFQGPAALRVWYRDSTLRWSRFGGISNLGQHPDALVDYRDFTADPAGVVEPQAIDLYFEAIRAFQANTMRRADSLFVLCIGTTKTRGGLYVSSMRNRARIAAMNGDLDRAEAFNQQAATFSGGDPAYWVLEARIAQLRGDRDGAQAALARCLALDPRNEEGLEIAKELGLR